MGNRIFNSSFIRICIASLLANASLQIIMTVLPLYLDELSFSPSVLGISNAMASFAALSMRPFAGIIADKHSKRLVMACGAFVMAITILGFSVFPFLIVILLLRTIQGAGISAATTAHAAAATDVLPHNKVESGICYFAVCATLANALGPVLGNQLIVENDYKFVWVGGSVMFFFSAIIAVSLNYEKKRKIQSEVSVCSESGRARQAKKGLWDFFDKSAIMPSAIQFLVSLACASTVFLPTYGKSLGIDNMALFFTIQSSMMLSANLIVAKVFPYIKSPIFVLLPALTVFASSCLVLFLASNNVMFFGAAALYGFSLGATTSTVSVLCMSKALPERRGAASATYQCAGDCGYCFGSFGWGLVATALGYKAVYGIATIFPIIALAVSLFVFTGFGNRKSKV